jgi:hypothetical protein
MNTAKRLDKRENEELDTFSEWFKSMRGISKSRIRNIKTKVRTIYTPAFSKPEVKNELERLRGKFPLVPADKGCKNIVFVFKAHYCNCILNEFCINSTFDNPTYTPTAPLKDEILQTHRSFSDTFNIPVNGMNEFELQYIYLIPKLHKNPYKHRYIA